MLSYYSRACNVVDITFPHIYLYIALDMCECIRSAARWIHVIWRIVMLFVVGSFPKLSVHLCTGLFSTIRPKVLLFVGCSIWNLCETTQVLNLFRGHFRFLVFSLTIIVVLVITPITIPLVGMVVFDCCCWICTSRFPSEFWLKFCYMGLRIVYDDNTGLVIYLLCFY